MPDVEARVWRDGRIYLYGSMDTSGDTFYCSDKLHVFSSADMIHWTDHGCSFHITDSHSSDMTLLFAPDCTCVHGKYVLCYCGNSGVEGLATSTKPEGPFQNAFAVQGADKDGIDPCMLADDDGVVYYYWGQFHLRGARLTSDLRAIDRETYVPDLLTEENDGFHEGACIRKRNGLYYLVYTDISRGKATCLGYAVSEKPLGPYRKQGIIIDNTGCDPDTWNNHGSIAEFNGQWYVFYHRSSQGSKYNRRVCVEPIRFNADGSIDEVEMTTQGQQGPLDARQTMEAWRACQLDGKACTAQLYAGPLDEPCEEILTQIHAGDRAIYKYLDFGAGVTSFRATVSTPFTGGKITIRLDHRGGPRLGEVEVPATNGWRTWRQVETALEVPLKEVHAVYLNFSGRYVGRVFDLRDFVFQ